MLVERDRNFHSQGGVDVLCAVCIGATILMPAMDVVCAVQAPGVLKSEIVSAEDRAGPVTIVKGDSFNELVGGPI